MNSDHILSGEDKIENFSFIVHSARGLFVNKTLTIISKPKPYNSTSSFWLFTRLGGQSSFGCGKNVILTKNK